MPPSTPKKRQLTRDQRLRIQTLHEGGWEIDVIHAHLRARRSFWASRESHSARIRRARDWKEKDLLACVFSRPQSHWTRVDIDEGLPL